MVAFATIKMSVKMANQNVMKMQHVPIQMVHIHVNVIQDIAVMVLRAVK